MTFGSAMQNMNLGATTLGFDYRSGEGGRSLGLSSTFTPPTLMESVQLGAMGINPAAPSAALGLHMGASAGILQLTAHQGKMNAANVSKAIRGVRSAAAVGTPSTTSGRITATEAFIKGFREAFDLDEESDAKAEGEGKSVAGTGGDGEDPGSDDERDLLHNDLCNQEQMSQPGKITHTSSGTTKKDFFRNAEKYARDFGGDVADYVKKTSTSRTLANGEKCEVHWVENLKTGERYNFKTVFPKGL